MMDSEQQLDVLEQLHESGMEFEASMRVNVAHLMAMSGDDVFKLRASKGLLDSMRFTFSNASEAFQELIDEAENKTHRE